jgi:hypothetical protein
VCCSPVLRGNHTLSAALTGITAAVVGVIGNLGLYFAVNTFFDRQADPVDQAEAEHDRAEPPPAHRFADRADDADEDQAEPASTREVPQPLAPSTTPRWVVANVAYRPSRNVCS